METPAWLWGYRLAPASAPSDRRRAPADRHRLSSRNAYRETPDRDAGHREGIHRDGRHLYPAFPYTHFAKTTDADLQALYAYLMAQTPVRADTPKATLAFPFNWRPLMAGWNALFHE